MTDAELLQQCKDEVAKEMGHETFQELRMCESLHYILKCLDLAGERAIQSAREEARTGGYNDGYKAACADRAEKDKPKDYGRGLPPNTTCKCGELVNFDNGDCDKCGYHPELN